jgi:hypothetical protein
MLDAGITPIIGCMSAKIGANKSGYHRFAILDGYWTGKSADIKYSSYIG